MGSLKGLFAAFIGAVCAVVSAPASSQAPVDPALIELWTASGLRCPSGDGWPEFASSQSHDGGPCGDGDLTLFHGLMCAAGLQDGCRAVKASQVADGSWYRSPRRAAKHLQVCGNPSSTPEEVRDWCQNSFSPDMGLGAQLYVALTGDDEALVKWVRWMDENRPCQIGSGPDCVRGLPRFCTDDTEGGCTLRFGDLAVLGVTLEKRRLLAFPSDCNQPLGGTLKLSDLFGKALCTFRPKVYDIIWTDSQVNKPGYSQHLVGAEIHLLRLLGADHPMLYQAASSLARKQPKNPYFRFLRDGPTVAARDLTLALCPANAAAVPKLRDDWAWQRDDAAEAWKTSMMWDCVFMASLLK